jgi:Flp pilus assembly protein TadG
MRKLDRRGTAAFEFALVAMPLFTLMFVIFDLGRYAITMQSLRMLADAEARTLMVQCYGPAKIAKTPPSACAGVDYMSATQKQTVAPFLYFGGLTPAVSTAASANTLTIKATQPGFTMLMPIWGATLNAPGASISIPF